MSIHNNNNNNSSEIRIQSKEKKELNGNEWKCFEVETFLYEMDKKEKETNLCCSVEYLQ